MENNKKNNPASSESKSVRKVISEYMEQRRERSYKQDEAFHKAITPDHARESEGKRETVIYRNGVDTRFLIYIIVLLCFGAVMMYSAIINKICFVTLSFPHNTSHIAAAIFSLLLFH